MTLDDLTAYFASGGKGATWAGVLTALYQAGFPVDNGTSPGQVAAYFGIPLPAGVDWTAIQLGQAVTSIPDAGAVAPPVPGSTQTPAPPPPPSSSTQGGTMTVNGYSNNDLTAAQHSDASDPWFHFYWPLPGETAYVSWFPYDDRNNPSIYVEANQPGNVQRHPLPGTQITIGGVTLYGAGAGPTAPTAGTTDAVAAGLIPPAVVHTSPALNPPPPPPPPAGPPPVVPGSVPGAGSGGVAPATAPPLPTPPDPVGVNLAYLISLSAPVTFPAIPANINPPGAVSLLKDGKIRPSSSWTDALNVLNSGGGIARADGNEAVIQHVQFSGMDVDLGEGSPYLVDGNPLNVVAGQGWFPGQLDFVGSLVAAGVTIPPTLAIAPAAGGGGGIELFGANDFAASFPLLAAGGAVLYFLFFRKKRG